MANNNVKKVIMGGTGDMGLGAKTIFDGLEFKVRVIPVIPPKGVVKPKTVKPTKKTTKGGKAKKPSLEGALNLGPKKAGR